MNIKFLNSEFKFKTLDFLILITSSFCFFCIYYPQIFNTDKFILDDVIILEPILKAKTFLGIYKEKFVDIQPIRDLSYWVDIKLTPYFYFNVFKVSNLIYWFLCYISLIVFYKIYTEFFNISLSLTSLIIVASIILLHPSMSIPVCWISSRKHLLTFLFTLWASVFFLKMIFEDNYKKLYSFLSLIFLILAMGSHTIYCFWPFWACFTILQRNGLKKSWKKYSPYIITIFAIGLLAGSSNFIYYKFFSYKLDSPGGINVKYNSDTILYPILAYGRYFINFFDFSAPTIYYDSHTVCNSIGASIFLIFSLIIGKRFKTPIFANLSVFFFVTTVTFTFFILGTFTQNTYALMLTSIVFLAFLILLTESFPNIFKNRIFICLSVIIIAVQIGFTSFYGNLWRDNLKFVEHIKEREDVGDIKAWYIIEEASAYIKRGNYKDKSFLEKIVPVAYDLKFFLRFADFRTPVTSHQVYKAFNSLLFLIYSNQSLKDLKKKEIMELICSRTIVYCNYYYGMTLYLIEDYKQSSDFLNLTINQIKNIIVLGKYEGSSGISAKNWGYMIAQISNLIKISEDTKSNLKSLIQLAFQMKRVEIIQALNNSNAFLSVKPSTPSEYTSPILEKIYEQSKDESNYFFE